jgi:hypothetical protein
MKIAELFETLQDLPFWLQLSWAGWAIAGAALLMMTLHVGKPATAGGSLETTTRGPLLFGDIEVDLPYGYFMSATSADGTREFEVYAQPARVIRPPLDLHAQDIVLSFDVTNPNHLDVRAVDLFVEVLDFVPVTVRQTNPVEAAGEIRPFFCNIRNAKGIYKAEKVGDFDFIKLRNGELERFAIHVNTPDPGVYSLAIQLKYAIGAESYRTTVGRVPRLVGFFERVLR